MADVGGHAQEGVAGVNGGTPLWPEKSPADRLLGCVGISGPAPFGYAKSCMGRPTSRNLQNHDTDGNGINGLWHRSTTPGTTLAVPRRLRASS
jgi:hypothetical protein